MQNEQFMRAMMTVIQVPGKVEHFTSEQTERFAKMMRVATADEVKDLKRQVKALESEVAKLKKKIDSERATLGLVADAPLPRNPPHPERICWGCEEAAPRPTCGNGTERTPHPAELVRCRLVRVAKRVSAGRAW